MTKILDMMWEELEEVYGVAYESIHLVTDINGYNEDTMRDILYSVAGENLFAFEAEEMLESLEG